MKFTKTVPEKTGYTITQDRLERLDPVHRIAAEELIKKGEFVLVKS